MQAVQTTLIDYVIANHIPYTTELNQLTPAYDYITLQEFYRDHILERTYHYSDCDCSACHAAHYPCEDETCDYCKAVRSLLSQGKVKQDINGGIINFAEWNAWPMDYSWADSDMIYSTCDGCGILVNGYHRDNFHGFCSEDCQKENQVFYCLQCGSNEVDNHGDICESCEYADEETETDHAIYNMGDIVDSDDYNTVENCWIAPNGDMHYVPYCNHQRTAEKLGFSGVTQAENRGWIHVSVYWSRMYRFHYIPSKPTHAQIEVVNAYCEANDLPIPEEAQIKDYSNESKDLDQLMESVKMQNLSPAWIKLTRKTRDQFYPLSGD